MKTLKLTEERLASIPGLIAQGLRKREIAEMFGVKPASLQVVCCNKGISLRPGGSFLKRTVLTIPPDPLPDEKLEIPETILVALREEARRRGKSTSQLVCELIEKIVTDKLYTAVLDEE